MIFRNALLLSPVLRWLTYAVLVLSAAGIPSKQFDYVDAINCSPNADPCDVARPFVEKVTNFSRTAIFHAALITIQNKAGTAPGQEHTIAFGMDYTGNVISTDASTGERSRSRVPAISNGFADLHNHLRNTPPSSGDLYGLMRQNKKNRRYGTRYVITGAGNIYAFVVTDTSAASAFLLKYPPQQETGYSPLFPDALLDEYRDIQYKYGASEEMAMAYLLENYAAGVSLLKQEENGVFIQLRTSVSTAGHELVFRTNNCK